MQKYLQLSINTKSTEEQEILIANLNELFFEGFVEEENNLLAYIKESDFIKINTELKKLLENFIYNTKYIENINWNKEWEDSIKPLYFDNFLCIKTSFHNITHNCKYEIIITPKMSFGTGHHETTSSILNLMKNINFNNKNVLDFGAGTGILAILAEKLGANKIIAIDNDINCIESIKENIITNKTKNINYNQLDSLPNDFFDIILCNINLNFIVNNIEKLISILNKDGTIILSGFYNTDKEYLFKFLESKIENKIIKITNELKNNNWMAIEIKKI